MGVLPIVLPADQSLRVGASDLIDVDAGVVVPRGEVRLTWKKHLGEPQVIVGRAAVETEQEVETLRHGGMIPQILSRRLKA